MATFGPVVLVNTSEGRFRINFQLMKVFKDVDSEDAVGFQLRHGKVVPLYFTTHDEQLYHVVIQRHGENCTKYVMYRVGGGCTAEIGSTLFRPGRR